MNKIKPLIISRTLPYLGGREIMVDKIIKYFSNDGRIWVITPDKYIKNSKKITVINKINFDNNLIAALKKSQINIVNCHTFYLFEISYKISKYFKIPLVFTLHGVFIDIYGKKYNSIIKKIVDKSSLVITVSDAYSQRLKRAFPTKIKKIIKIQNGVKIIKTIRKNNDKITKIRYVVIPARLNKLKGLEYVAQVSKQLNDIRFCVCHPTGRKNNMEENKYKNNLIKKSNNFLYFKKLNHKNILLEMRKADLILLPSLIEGVSIAILEAMSLGKIVATTNVGGNPEIIKDGMNGFLFKSKSSDSIIKAINRISKLNQNSRKIISQKAILTVKNKFDINLMLKQYKNIFNNLINYENK